MEKLRILFTGDSITDVNRTDMVRMTEEWMSRDPNATPQQREEAVDRALGCGYPLLGGSQLGVPAAGGLPAGRPGARPL
ncbi:unknown [Firmicutes bacterium CAG:94]|nr:unknown [Firmicutes bacterium CAG:94]